MRTASPNQDGVEGTACEEVWIFTDTSAILLMIYLLVGNTFVLPHQGDVFFCSFATGYSSLRNSWAIRADYLAGCRAGRRAGYRAGWRVHRRAGRRASWRGGPQR